MTLDAKMFGKAQIQKTFHYSQEGGTGHKINENVRNVPNYAEGKGHSFVSW